MEHTANFQLGQSRSVTVCAGAYRQVWAVVSVTQGHQRLLLTQHSTVAKFPTSTKIHQGTSLPCTSTLTLTVTLHRQSPPDFPFSLSSSLDHDVDANHSQPCILHHFTVPEHAFLTCDRQFSRLGHSHRSLTSNSHPPPACLRILDFNDPPTILPVVDVLLSLSCIKMPTPLPSTFASAAASTNGENPANKRDNTSTSDWYAFDPSCLANPNPWTHRLLSPQHSF